MFAPDLHHSCFTCSLELLSEVCRIWALNEHQPQISVRNSVLWKMQNPGSPNGPPMVDGWVVRLSSGWSVNQ